MDIDTHPVVVLPEVAAFLTREHGHLIGHETVAASSRTMEVRDPASGAVIANVPEGTAGDVDRAVTAARVALRGEWSRLRPADRERLLHRLADELERHAEELAQLETLEQGKSIHLSRAIEVGASLEYLRYMAGWATKIEGSTLDLSIPMPLGVRHTGLTLREPVGVVGAITPWNFPLMTALWKLAPALACGCTIVLKPSELTPLTALRLAELVQAAGIPPGVVNIVTGNGATGAALAGHPDIDKISFTGSSNSGRKVGAAALEHMTRFTLELGGKNPMIVLSDIDLPQMLPGMMAGCFLNGGQVCAAASRIYVETGMFDKVVGGISQAIDSLTLGPGLDPAADFQPLVSHAHREKVAAITEEATQAGARIVKGGRRSERHGYFFEPTLIIDCDGVAALGNEIFGPVISVSPVKDLDDALRLANDSPYGLGASIWSNDLRQVLSAIRGLKAGTIWLNSHVPVDPNLPFGGFKQSGIGREHGRSMLDQYTELKSVVIPGL